MEAPEKSPSPRRHELIDHAEKVAVHVLQLGFEVVQKDQIVVIRERFEERPSLMVRGDEHCRIVRYFVPAVGVDLISLQASVFVLKISAADVEGVELSVGVANGIVVSCHPSYSRDDSSGSALDFVRISQMITNEALAPQVLPPILSIKSVSKDQFRDLDNARHMATRASLIVE